MLQTNGSKRISNKSRPTKRTPDAGDSAHIPSSFPRLSLFLVGRLRRPRPSAGNAHRSALSSQSKKMMIVEKNSVNSNKIVKQTYILFGVIIFFLDYCLGFQNPD